MNCEGIKFNYRRNVMPEKEVIVAVTPNGYADGLAADDKGKVHFVMPEEKNITVSEFLDRLDKKRLIKI